MGPFLSTLSCWVIKANNTCQSSFLFLLALTRGKDHIKDPAVKHLLGKYVCVSQRGQTERYSYECTRTLDPCASASSVCMPFVYRLFQTLAHLATFCYMKLKWKLPSPSLRHLIYFCCEYIDFIVQTQTLNLKIKWVIVVNKTWN